MKQIKIYQLVEEDNCGRTVATPHRSRFAIWKSLQMDISYATFLRYLQQGKEIWVKGNKITVNMGTVELAESSKDYLFQNKKRGQKP